MQPVQTFPPKYSVAVIQCRHTPCQFAMMFQQLLSSRMERCPVHLSMLVSDHALWSVCTSFLLLPQPPSFWPCVFYCYFFSDVILRIQFWIDCVLPPSAVVNLPTNTSCARGYLVSTPPHHHLHIQSRPLVDQLHKSWVGFTSGDPPFVIGMLPWNQGHWVTFPVSGPNNPNG